MDQGLGEHSDREGLMVDDSGWDEMLDELIEREDDDYPQEDQSIIPDNEVDEKTGVRNEKGQFVKGHPGVSPGRPRKSEEMKELETDFYGTLKKAAEEDGAMEAVCNKLIKKAQAGSYQHQRLLFQYLLGNPEQYINVTGDKPPMVLFDNENE